MWNVRFTPITGIHCSFNKKKILPKVGLNEYLKLTKARRKLGGPEMYVVARIAFKAGPKGKRRVKIL